MPPLTRRLFAAAGLLAAIALATPLPAAGPENSSGKRREPVASRAEDRYDSRSRSGQARLTFVSRFL